MLLKYSNLLFAFLITLFCVLLTYFFAGIFYSEYEGLNTALLSSALTPGMPFRSVYFSGNMGISYFYSLFYEYLPGVAWISWLELFWMVLASSLALGIIWSIVNRNYNLMAKVGILCGIFLVVFADHFIQLIYTRVAYLVCGFSLITLLHLFAEGKDLKRKIVPFLLLNFFFLVGTLIRNEAAMACVLLLIPFSLFYTKSIKLTLFIFAFPALLVAGQTVFFAVDIRNASANEFYKQVEPDIEEQFIARRNVIPISTMTTAKDSATYLLGTEMVFCDPKVMSADVLRSFIKKGTLPMLDSQQWFRVYQQTCQIINRYLYLVLFTLLLSVCVFLQTHFTRKKELFYYFLFAASFWGLTILQTYVDKVNERSWLPYIGLFIYCHLLILLQTTESKLKIRNLVMIIGGVIFLFFQVKQLIYESQQMKDEYTNGRAQYTALKKIAAGKILVINSSAFQILFSHNTPFEHFDFSDFEKVYITESYIIPFLPYYKQYLEKECQCDIYNYPSFWRFLQQSKSDVIVVSSEERMNAIQNYNRVVYHHALNLSPIPLQRISSMEWNAWQLNK